MKVEIDGIDYTWQEKHGGGTWQAMGEMTAPADSDHLVDALEWRDWRNSSWREQGTIRECRLVESETAQIVEYSERLDAMP